MIFFSQLRWHRFVSTLHNTRYFAFCCMHVVCYIDSVLLLAWEVTNMCTQPTRTRETDQLKSDNKFAYSNHRSSNRSWHTYSVKCHIYPKYKTHTTHTHTRTARKIRVKCTTIEIQSLILIHSYAVSHSSSIKLSVLTIVARCWQW